MFTARHAAPQWPRNSTLNVHRGTETRGTYREKKKKSSDALNLFPVMSLTDSHSCCGPKYPRGNRPKQGDERHGASEPLLRPPAPHPPLSSPTAPPPPRSGEVLLLLEEVRLFLAAAGVGLRKEVQVLREDSPDSAALPPSPSPLRRL